MNNDKFAPPEPPGFGYSSAPPNEPHNYPPPPSYSQHEYPPQGYPQAGYSQPGCSQQAYPHPGYPPQGYPPQGYPQQGHPQQGFPQPVHPQQMYPPHTYPPQNYGPPPPQNYGPPPPQNYGPPPPQHFEPQPPPPQPLPQQNIIFVRPSGCYTRTKMNRPQSNTLAAATFIFVTGGMNLAWSVGFRHNNYFHLSMNMRVAWFVGAIVGAAISAFLPKVIPRRAIAVFCSMLVLIGGIVNCSTHYNLEALMANLYLNGIANGLVFAPSLALAGELSVFYMRGKITTNTEQLSINLGIFLQIAICSGYTYHYSYSGINPDRISGIITAVFGLMGLIFAAVMFIESPVFMVSMRREQAAIDALRRLQRLPAPSDQTLAQLEEHKLYVTESESLTSEESIMQAFPAFFKLAVLRALSAISISSFFFDMLYMSHSHSYSYYQEQYLIFGACRLLGSFLASIVVDSLGRKTPVIVGLLGCTVFAFVAASQVLFGYSIILPFLYVFQFFAGLTFTTSSTYLSEAFPLQVKQQFIGITFIVELLVFIIIEASDLILGFLYIFGGILATALVAALICLPETRRTTLRGALKKFNKYVSLCDNNTYY